MVGLMLVTLLWTLCSSLPLEPPRPLNDTIVSEYSTVDIITSDDTDVSLDVDGVHYHIVGANAREGRVLDVHEDAVIEISAQDGDGFEVTKYHSHHHVGDEINPDDERDGRQFSQNTFNLGDIEISGTVQANRISIGSHVNIGGNFDHEDLDEHDHMHDHKFIGQNLTFPDIVVSDENKTKQNHHPEPLTPGLNAEDEKDLKAAFDYVDENGDELLSADELFNACLKLDIQITADGASKMVIISQGEEEKSGVNYVKFGHLLKFAPSFNKRDLIHFWVHAAGFQHGLYFEMDDDFKYRSHLYYVFLILDQDHDGELSPTDLMMTFDDMGGKLGETEAEKMAGNLAGVHYGLNFEQWVAIINTKIMELEAIDLAQLWRKVFRFYLKEGIMTGYNRRHVDSGVRRAVGNHHIVQKLNKLKAITKCPPVEVKAVEEAWIEVVEGLNYKLKIMIKTRAKIGASCSREVLKVCDNVVVFKPLPNVCKGVHCLRLQDTEHIKCRQVSSTLERCIDNCQRESCQTHRDLKEGCQQRFTCAHGCQMRHLGLDEAACLENCGRDDDCSPVVQGWEFHLCHDCDRHDCSTKVPAKEECEQGCQFYTDAVPKAMDQVADANRKAMDQVADANRMFACALYKSLKTQEVGENLLMSPYSASSVMAMAYMGAEGETHLQMMMEMHFPEKNAVAAGYKDVLRLLKGNEHFTLETANRLFVQNGFQLLEAFETTMKEKFYSEVKQLDFANSEEATKEINDWVKEKTNTIGDLIPKDLFASQLLEAFKAAINEDPEKFNIADLVTKGLHFAAARMVLVNAIYFKGNWTHQFAHEDTYGDHFYVTNDVSVEVMMMHNNRSEFKMSHCLELKAKTIKLPYKGDRISMYIVLPDDEDGLDEVEGKLCGKKIKEVRTKTDDQVEKKFSLYLPKFKMEKTIEMKSNLEALGMTNMFSLKADFSGINGNEDLSVINVIQKAFLEVDELGSEAYPPYYPPYYPPSYFPPNLAEFKCDHPFLFFIYDKETNMMLFRGRVLHPTPAHSNIIPLIEE